MIMDDLKDASQLTSDYVLSESIFAETHVASRRSSEMLQSNGLSMARDLSSFLMSSKQIRLDYYQFLYRF